VPFRATYPLAGLICVLLYAVVGWLLSGYPVARAVVGNVALILSAGLVIGIILRRQRCWAGCHRLFWNTIAVGIGLWIVGHIGWAIDIFQREPQPWLQWHTVFSLCGGIAPLIALLARPHRGVRPHAPAIVGIDVAANGLLAVFVYAYLVLVPSTVPGMAEEARDKLLLLIQIHRALFLSGLLVATWFARDAAWRFTYLRLALGVAIGFIFRFGTSLAISRGDYQIGSLHDLAWIVPWLCYAWAAAEAPSSERSEQAVEFPDTPTPIAYSAVPLLLIPLIGYGTLYLDAGGSQTHSFRVLLTSVTTVCGFALLTMRMAAQGGELQRADARLKLLAAATEQTADLILITRADGRFEHANDAFRRALGYTKREIEPLSFAELMDARSTGIGANIVRQVTSYGIWRGTLLRRRKDGSTFPVASTVVGLRNPADEITHFVGVERDISEELRLRDQLVHSERLSAIGELVAGVAHEINNPLQTIIGSVELMLDVRPGEVNREDLELVRREAARAGQIVRNLLTFVRRGAPDRLRADLNQIVRATVELRRFHLEQHNIAIRAVYESAYLSVLVNRDEIQQVILNLLLNAEHAIVKSGRHGGIEIRTFTDADRHVVEVHDSGPGISPEMRGRIFEPFFTTKDVGEGTGLGLSISHGIATAHGGVLELRETEAGAKFRLSLPCYQEIEESLRDVTGFAPSVERALVVDDEVPIRRLLARLLERRGFDVLEAGSSEAALELGTAPSISLVLCDVRMPGINGFELYRRLTAARPSLSRAFLFISGDTSSAEHAMPEFAHVPVLGKPFTAADLDVVIGTMNGRSEGRIGGEVTGRTEGASHRP
jgi:PAS domain S-box-containing protein